jgi:hypothetical protein
MAVYGVESARSCLDGNWNKRTMSIEIIISYHFYFLSRTINPSNAGK